MILVRWETTPDDIHGLLQANGILTAHGGMTSHAAVVARGMGKPCVAGCEGLTIDLDARTFSLNGRELAEVLSMFRPELRVLAMTGFPAAIASAIVSPNPSARCRET